VFTRDYRRQIREVVTARADELWRAYEAFGANIYRDHPFYEHSDPGTMLRKVLASLSPDLFR
jgi:hypothetical protein